MEFPCLDGREWDVGEEDGGKFGKDIAECGDGWEHLQAMKGSEEAGEDVGRGGEGEC
jgi:hypothetical protein